MGLRTNVVIYCAISNVPSSTVYYDYCIHVTATPFMTRNLHNVTSRADVVFLILYYVV